MCLWSVITLTCQNHTWWCAFPDVKSSVSPEMVICSKGWPLCCGCNSIFWVHLGQTNELNKCPFLLIWPVMYPNRRLDNGIEGFLIWRFLNTRADHLWDKKQLKKFISENNFEMFCGFSQKIKIWKIVIFMIMCVSFLFFFYFNFFATPQIKMKTIQEKIERMDLTMARRPKGNYEAYIN